MRRAGIRFQLTALAVLAVALVLVVAGGSLVLLQRRALTASLDRNLIQRADDLEVLIADSDPMTFAATIEEGFTQLLGTDGSVEAASPNLAGAGPIVAVGEPGRDVIETREDLPVDDDQFRVLTRTLGDRRTLILATTADIVGEGTGSLLAALAIGVPVLVAALGALIWWLVGRTLRPVDAITREAAAITTADLHRRVPVPVAADEIATLATTVNSMLERLDRQVERQRRFVADASHELRTPLTRLRSAMEVERPRYPDVFEPFLEEAVSMQNLVEDMLYLARSDEDPAAPVDVAVDLDDVVLREVREARAAGIRIDTSGVSGAHVQGDRSQLARLVRNLLDNAIRHAETSVVVTLGETDGTITMQVADDGPGVDPTDGERIFDRFARLDDARSSGGGTGLGLAIAREIALRHGGSLDLVAGDGPGATFRLRLRARP